MSQSVPGDGEIDPELRRFIAALAERSAGYPPSPSYAERRRAAERAREPLRAGGPSFDESRDYAVPHDGGEIRVRVINAARGDRKPALVYLHGGGWMLFSIDTHDRIMRELAARAGIAVVGVDYSLSPEVRYPTQLEEVRAVLAWLRERSSELGVEAGNIAIGGDSAGANLSVAACLELREAGELAGMRGMLLCYGVYDARFNTPSYARYADPAYVLSSEEMQEFWRCYVRSEADYDDPLVSPLRADLAGLPPAFMIIAERDVLYDENVSMAEKLRAAGVDVSSNVYGGTTHSFLEAVSMAEVSARALRDAASWLQDRLLSRPVARTGSRSG